MTADRLPTSEHVIEALQAAGLPLLDQLMVVTILASDDSEETKRFLLGATGLARDHEPADPRLWEEARVVVAQLHALHRQRASGGLDIAAHEAQLRELLDPLSVDLWLCVLNLRRSDALALEHVLRRTHSAANREAAP